MGGRDEEARRLELHSRHAAGLNRGGPSVAQPMERDRLARRSHEDVALEVLERQTLLSRKAGREATGVDVDPVRVSLYTIPIAIASILIGAAQYTLLDRWLRRRRPEAPREDGDG